MPNASLAVAHAPLDPSLYLAFDLGGRPFAPTYR